MERISGRHRLKLALRRPFRISWSSRPGLLGFREEIQGLSFTCGASMMSEHLWVGIGLLGEAQFGARFLVQWIASERQKKSVVPHTFWYLSIPPAFRRAIDVGESGAPSPSSPVRDADPAKRGGRPVPGPDLSALYRCSPSVRRSGTGCTCSWQGR